MSWRALPRAAEGIFIESGRKLPVLRHIDHVILGVADLTRAARDYAEGLGFAVSAGGAHPGLGTQNRLIVLDPEYVELITRLPGHTPGTTASSPITAMFARASGAIGFALASDDIEADVAAMRARGVPASGPVAGRLEGPHGTARGWRMAHVDDDAGLGADPWRLPFVIQHDSAGQERLSHIAQPDGLRPHPIGATHLAEVTVAVRDLSAGLRSYALAFGLEPDDEEGEDATLGARTIRLPLERGAIVLAAPLDGDGPLARGLAAHGEGLYSVAVAVADLQGAVDCIRGRGIGVRVEEPEGVLAAARPDTRSTHGARLALVQA